MFYADRREVIKELGEGVEGVCGSCGGKRTVWNFLALTLCLNCLTDGGGGGDAGAVQVLKGPET